MPAERRSFTAARPVKTERTHEENQERAYIAASRRSDRSLEARIESARRASEIHKKRTGRALRVTEQDVINEEMYEEEDDDLPAQYQRLNAHLHTTSVMFNKKLHDYIATQHGVRNMFMSQYQNPSFQPYGAPSPSTGTSFPQTNNWLNPAMLPPQQTSPSTPQGFQHAQPYSPSTAQPHTFRQSPYQIPQRLSPHQRSFSIQLPHNATFFDPSAPAAKGAVATSQADVNRRLSLPPQMFEQANLSAPERSSHSSLSRSPTVHSPQSAASPTLDQIKETARSQPDADTPTSYSYSPGAYTMPQMMNTTPLALSLPPESQQLIGTALDPNDPRTAIFMSGSDNLPQPFASTYGFDSSYTKPSAVTTSGAATCLGPAQNSRSGLTLKIEDNQDSTSTLPSAISDGFYPKDEFLTPGNGDYNAFFGFQGPDFGSSSQEQAANEQLDGSIFVNWD